VLGRGLEPVDVGVDDPDRERPRSLDFGLGQVGAGCELPGDADRFGGGSEEPSGQVAVAKGERVP
jgi:hypothetical protein